MSILVYGESSGNGGKPKTGAEPGSQLLAFSPLHGTSRGCGWQRSAGAHRPRCPGACPQETVSRQDSHSVSSSACDTNLVETRASTTRCTPGCCAHTHTHTRMHTRAPRLRASGHKSAQCRHRGSAPRPDDIVSPFPLSALCCISCGYGKRRFFCLRLPGRALSRDRGDTGPRGHPSARCSMLAPLGLPGL